MKYKITYSYNWYETEVERFIIKTYYINSIPFAFDDISIIAQEDLEIIELANNQLLMTPEIFYQKSFYLIDEECHPMLFPVDIENPEDLPDGLNEEDLTN